MTPGQARHHHCDFTSVATLARPGPPCGTCVSIFLIYSFIEMSFAYYKVHPLKVHSSGVFSIFTKLCNHHRCFRKVITPERSH